MKIEKNILKYGALAGILEGVYVILVGLFMINVESIFSSDKAPALSIFSFLLLFVFSAGISGLIVFGYPMKLLKNGSLRDAVLCLVVTLSTLLILLCITLLLYLVYTA
ncbi:hypothetical protein KKG41_04735 [Patescibacteria group bacterium]|nr:hypothetical protein [Patescibacteria group bacterium]MBU1890816.1 hypothetical protein [Patescibacteria group bacterium]